MRETSIDVQCQLKALRLNGMATAWTDLTKQGGGKGGLTEASNL